MRESRYSTTSRKGMFLAIASSDEWVDLYITTEKLRWHVCDWRIWLVLGRSCSSRGSYPGVCHELESSLDLCLLASADIEGRSLAMKKLVEDRKAVPCSSMHWPILGCSLMFNRRKKTYFYVSRTSSAQYVMLNKGVRFAGTEYVQEASLQLVKLRHSTR